MSMIDGVWHSFSNFTPIPARVYSLRKRFKSSRVRLGNVHIHPNLPD